MKKPFLIALAGVVLAAGTQASAWGETDNLTLIDNAKSEYQILVGKGRSVPESARMGARELQTYLEKVTGVKLPIVHKYEQGRKYIVVGEHAHTKELGLSLKDVKPEGFIIKIVNEHLVLMGRDTRGGVFTGATQTGSLFAVYTFLEQFCGIRWFLPTELGEVAPEQKRLTIPAVIDIKQEPAFMSRSIRVGGDYPDKYGPRDPGLMTRT